MLINEGNRYRIARILGIYVEDVTFIGDDEPVYVTECVPDDGDQYDAICIVTDAYGVEHDHTQPDNHGDTGDFHRVINGNDGTYIAVIIARNRNNPENRGKKQFVLEQLYLRPSANLAEVKEALHSPLQVPACARAS